MEKESKTKNGSEVTEESDSDKMKLHVHVPDGLPKSQEELEEVISVLRKAAANDDSSSSAIIAETKDIELSLKK